MTAHPHPRHRVALLLATAALGVATLTACSDDDGSATDPADGASSSLPSTAATDTAGADPSASADPSDNGDTPDAGGGSGTVAVPLYFVGDTPQGPRLYREFQQVEAADPLGEAAARVAGGQSADPDYRTLWPAGGFESVVVDEQAQQIVITLAAGGSPDEAVRMTPRQAKLAVQQMVYTLQGVSQTRDPLVVKTSDGTPTSIFGIDTTGGVGNRKELAVLALVSVTTPEQGGAVSGTFTATGVASSFEGTVPWLVTAADGSVVKDGAATAEGYVDKLYPWTTEVDLSGVAPGDYTFVAMTEDPSDGEGRGPTEDTKAITVQ